MKNIYVYFYFFLGLLIKLACAMSRSDFGKPFLLLPPNSDWHNQVKNLCPNEIKNITSTYMKPFKEYQFASRNLTITSHQLKQSFVSAITLLLESTRNFSLSLEEYENSKDNLEPVLDMARAVFKLKRASDLAPVFNVTTIEEFSVQRLKHMVTHKPGYLNFLARKSKHETILQEWKIISSRLPNCQFRKLLSRNLDFDYVEHMVMVYLDIIRMRAKELPHGKLSFRLRVRALFHKDDLVQKIEALGNGYSTSTPPYSIFTIMVMAFYTLLVAVLI